MRMVRSPPPPLRPQHPASASKVALHRTSRSHEKRHSSIVSCTACVGRVVSALLKITPQSNAAGGDDGDDWAFTPTSKLPDAERFRGVEPLKMTCRACHQQADFQGVFAWDRKKPVNSPADLKVRLDTHP